MLKISSDEVVQRIKAENPWWERGAISQEFRALRPRAYFRLFFPLVHDQLVRRATVLMGPRRVGKTVLLHQAVDRLISLGVPPSHIAYLSVDHPLYNGLSLERMLQLYLGSVEETEGPRYVFFDEIQYLRDWEIHLKVLVDSQPDIRFVASGSAAAALKLKSRESGAGRFTDFILPPLSFYEYLDLLDLADELVSEGRFIDRAFFVAKDITKLNDSFLQYLNFGGYPEVVFSPAIQKNPSRFIKSDIIDKVLLRDLPSLYGIQNIQELNQLFTTLAFNTSQEISLEELASNSGVAKNTLKRYIEYLEAAFLIRVVHRIDQSAKRFKRARTFKVYLTNPSMRAALFSPVTSDVDVIGALSETAVFSQWFHSELTDLFYSRWKTGEVDLIQLGPDQKPLWALEVKWSDRFVSRPGELKSLRSFAKKNNLKRVWSTSRTIMDSRRLEDGLEVVFIPTSVYCFTLGHNIIYDKMGGLDG